MGDVLSPLEREGRPVATVVVDEIAHDGHILDRGEKLAVPGVGSHAGTVVSEYVVDQEQVRRGVGAGVTETAELAHRVGDDCVAGVALPDVIGGVRRTGGIGMLE